MRQVSYTCVTARPSSSAVRGPSLAWAPTAHDRRRPTCCRSRQVQRGCFRRCCRRRRCGRDVRFTTGLKEGNKNPQKTFTVLYETLLRYSDDSPPPFPQRIKLRGQSVEPPERRSCIQIRNEPGRRLESGKWDAVHGELHRKCKGYAVLIASSLECVKPPGG